MLSTSAQAAYDGGWKVQPLHTPPRRLNFRPWPADSFLGMLSREALQELESMVSISEHKAGDTLFMEQQLLPGVFIVLAGDVRLSLNDAGGRGLTVHIAKRGSVLGAHSALFASPSDWTADTLYFSKIAFVKLNDFLRFADRYPEAYRLATIELTRTLRYTCRTLRMVGLSCCVRKRLASQLLAWGEQGNKSGDQTQYCLVLTHAQIAEFIGAVRETVTRAMTAFKKRGLVDIRGTVLTIPSTTALRRYAERP